jgi:hypothetical protein
VPILAAAGFGVYAWSAEFENVTELIGTILNLLAILIGFSITAVTILSASDSATVRELKQAESDRTLDGKPVSLFRLLHLRLTYTLLTEIFALVVNLCVAYSQTLKDAAPISGVVLSVNALLLLHIIAVNLRNTVSLYLVFWRQDGGK